MAVKGGSTSQGGFFRGAVGVGEEIAAVFPRACWESAITAM